MALRYSPLFRHRSYALVLALPLSAAAAVKTYDIPPQPLPSALTAFADQSDTRLLYESAMTRGLNSRGASGSLSPEEALDRLLAGTGLRYRRTADGAITLSQGSSPLPVVAAEIGAALPKVTVTSSALDNPNDPYSRSYAVTQSSTASRTDTPLMETPISVETVTRAVMADQQAVQVGDAIKNVSGTLQGNFQGGFAEEFVIRGFSTGFVNGVYLDGFRWPASRLSVVNAQRVDVVKGAAANLYGRIQPGGMINIVTKRPQAKPYYALEQQFGSYDLYRTTLDATGAVTKDASLMYRFNLEYLDKNSFRDFGFTDRSALAPSVTWKLAERTQLDLDFFYSNEDTQQDYGLVASTVTRRPIKLPISRYLGEPSTDKSNTTLYYAALTLSHAFDDDWQIKARFNYFERDITDTETYGVGLDDKPSSPTYGILQRDFFRALNPSENYYGNVNLTGRFSTWDIDHQVLFGWEHYSSPFNRIQSWFDVPSTINIFDPHYDPADIAKASHDYSDSGGSNSNGLYFQDQVVLFEKLHVLAGGRYDWVSDVSGDFSLVSFADSRAHQTTQKVDRFSPRFGLLYQPWDWLSLYGNYAESLGDANSAQTPTGGRIGPETGEQFEVGFKNSFFNGRLISNLAYYHLTKQNIAVPIIGTPYFDAIGKARSEGFEVDVSGEVTEGLRLIAAYAYTDAIVLNGTSFDGVSLDGNRLVNAPRNAASFWMTYDLPWEPVRGLTVGAGSYLQSQKAGDRFNSFELPGWVRMDLMAKYQIPVEKARLTLQFNVQNLLDKEYYEASAGSNTSVLPASPRTFMGSIRVEY